MTPVALMIAIFGLSAVGAAYVVARVLHEAFTAVMP